MLNETDPEYKYAAYIVDLLIEHGFTDCFFVAGGNIMHLLDAARTRLKCTPFIHEASAAIASEYFNEVSRHTSGRRSVVCVTAGPGITNALTGIAGAWLESRSLLIIGGQVKSTDLKKGRVRQAGIQEIDGISLVRGMVKNSIQINKIKKKATLVESLEDAFIDRRGPVFWEFCIDIQGQQVPRLMPRIGSTPRSAPASNNVKRLSRRLARRLARSKRPVLLLGGGVRRDVAAQSLQLLNKSLIPIMTTWNAADRVPFDNPRYFGRPNTWGMRYSNVILQQCDLLIALGSRLGLQQTGFNWESFAPLAHVIHVDIDSNELHRPNPGPRTKIRADANSLLLNLATLVEREHVSDQFQEWSHFCAEVRDALPLSEESNQWSNMYFNPYDFVISLSKCAPKNSVCIPCSSGGAFTVFMQAFQQQREQLIVSNKGLASMGYGLSGSIGAAIAEPHRCIILNEGDGGFAQNLQELGTVRSNSLNIKMFIWANDGYASIRMTQRNYFNGAWIGCDTSTGLGLPDWKSLASAFDIPFITLDPFEPVDGQLLDVFRRKGPEFILIPIDPDQTYFPKISSRVTSDGSMESAPLHQMTPPLSSEVEKKVLRYL